MVLKQLWYEERFLFCFVLMRNVSEYWVTQLMWLFENVLPQQDTWRYGDFFVSFPSHPLSHCLQFLWQMSWKSKSYCWREYTVHLFPSSEIIEIILFVDLQRHSLVLTKTNASSVLFLLFIVILLLFIFPLLLLKIIALRLDHQIGTTHNTM